MWCEQVGEGRDCRLGPVLGWDGSQAQWTESHSVASPLVPRSQPQELMALQQNNIHKKIFVCVCVCV